MGSCLHASVPAHYTVIVILSLICGFSCNFLIQLYTLSSCILDTKINPNTVRSCSPKKLNTNKLSNKYTILLKTTTIEHNRDKKNKKIYIYYNIIYIYIYIYRGIFKVKKVKQLAYMSS